MYGLTEYIAGTFIEKSMNQMNPNLKEGSVFSNIYFWAYAVVFFNKNIRIFVGDINFISHFVGAVLICTSRCIQN